MYATESEYHSATSTMCAWGRIKPVGLIGKRRKSVFLHGIGESGTKKTIRECVDFCANAGLRRAVEQYGIEYIIPQDADANVSTAPQIQQIMNIVNENSDGSPSLGGLSMGGGITSSLVMSSSALRKVWASFYTLCPPTWSAMDQAAAAQLEQPWWIIHGAKDQAASATSINVITSTVNDLIKAGKKNLYFSVFPNDDHYIWNEVLGSIGQPFINPLNGASKWTNSAGTITVPCVNDPAVDLYQFLLMQSMGVYKPLPLLSSMPPEVEPTPQPIPPPPPPTTPTTPAVDPRTIKLVAASDYNRGDLDFVECEWTDKVPTIYRCPVGKKIRVTRSVVYGGAIRATVFFEGGGYHILGPTKLNM